MQETTKQLLTSLGTLERRLPQSADEVCETITKLGERNEAIVVPSLLAFIWPNEQFAKQMGEAGYRVRTSALWAIGRVMASLTAAGIVELDARMRHGYYGYYQSFSPETVQRVAPTPERVYLLAILASDHSGYTREAAVRALDRIDDGTELPFLILRTTDWVGPIRSAARAAVLSKLAVEAYRPHFVRMLPLLSRIGASSRADAREVVAAVRLHLLGEAGRPTLLSALMDTDAELRREVCRVLDNAAEIEPRAAEMASRDHDTVVRRFVIRWEPRLRRVDPASALAIRRRMLKNSVPQIRSAGLRAMRDAEPEKATEYLVDSLDDESATVRLTARHYLHGQIDFASHYRERLKTSRKPIGAIAGLGETGTTSDFDLVLPYLAGRSKQGQAVIKALGHLDKERGRDVCLEALIDRRGGVRRVALNTLGYRIRDEEAPLVADLWRRASENTTATLALASTRLLPWTGLAVLLGAVEFQPAAVEALAKWKQSSNSMYAPAPPDDERRLVIRRLLEANAALLPDEIVRRITKSIDAVQ